MEVFGVIAIIVFVGALLSLVLKFVSARWLVLIAGAIGLIIGLSMETAVETYGGGYVNNLGLMQRQQNVLIISGIIVLIGAYMVMKKGKKSEDVSELKKCSYCAESIKKEAVLCRFCGKDV